MGGLLEESPGPRALVPQGKDPVGGTERANASSTHNARGSANRALFGSTVGFSARRSTRREGDSGCPMTRRAGKAGPPCDPTRLLQKTVRPDMFRQAMPLPAGPVIG